MIKRRAVIGAAAAELFLVASHAAQSATPVATSRIAQVCSAPAETAEQFFERTRAVPADLDAIFLGYSATSINPVFSGALQNYQALAFNTFNLLNRDGVMEIANDMVAVDCGPQKGIIYNIQSHRLDRRAHDIFNQVFDQIKSFRQEQTNASYGQKIELTCNILLNTFRDVPYQMHQDYAGSPKTPAQLMSDNIGDCKDFAVSRAILALALGVRPDHVMLVIYGNEHNIADGHANVAIYDPLRKTWIVIENTGRSEHQKLGDAIAYNNQPEAYQAFLDFVGATERGMMVPILGVTQQGIFAFDSLDVNIVTQGKQKVISLRHVNAPKPIPVNATEKFIIVEPSTNEKAWVQPVSTVRSVPINIVPQPH